MLSFAWLIGVGLGIPFYRRFGGGGAPPAGPSLPPITAHYRTQQDDDMIFLKQSTASQSIMMGPFLDDTDGKTPETGLTIAAANIRLSKNGANIAAKNSGGGTHDELGYYTITLDATDTDTVGRLQLFCNMSGALPVRHTFFVLEENVYDAWFAASAAAGTDLAAVLTDTGTTIPAVLGTPAGADLAADIATVDSNVDAVLVDTGTTIPGVLGTPAGADLAADIAAVDTVVDSILVDTGTTLDGKINTIDTVVDAIKVATDAQENRVGTATCDTGGSVTSVIASSITPTSIEDDQFNGRVIVFHNDTTTTALRGQATDITDYTHSTTTFTVTALSEAPVSGDTFDIL